MAKRAGEAAGDRERIPEPGSLPSKQQTPLFGLDVGLPAGLPHAGNQTPAGHVAEADAADTEFPVNTAWPTTQPTPQAYADQFPWRNLRLLTLATIDFQKLQLFGKFRLFRFDRHAFYSSPDQRMLPNCSMACRFGDAIFLPRSHILRPGFFVLRIPRLLSPEG
jgi:hypothetical protein